MTFLGVVVVGRRDRRGENEGEKLEQENQPDARGISAETKPPDLSHCTLNRVITCLSSKGPKSIKRSSNTAP